MRVISASAANRKSRSRAISDEVQVSKNGFSKPNLGHHVYDFRTVTFMGGTVSLPTRSISRRGMIASPWGAVGATHQTVLERGTAEHSDRPHRGQASALKSKPPELGPSGPRWTRCDNRCNFPITQDCTEEYRNTDSAHFSNRSG